MLKHELQETLHKEVGSKFWSIHKPKLILESPHMPRPTSYFDRKQTIWTHEQMMARLKERCPPIRSEAAQSPKEKSVLKWGRAVVGCTEVKTECGRYSCSKVTTTGKTSYELWKANASGSPFVRLHQGLDNFLQAQKLAEQDHDKDVHG